MRVAVIGARQAHQGIGEHLARFCHQAGAEVAAVFGTTPATASAAAQGLARRLGLPAPAAHTDAESLLAEPGLSALIIAAPHAAHECWLQRAFERRLHVLCEKPLLWGGRHPDLRAETCARAFLAAGLHLHVHTQWPHTLPTYRKLFPEVALRPSQFAMRLSPQSRGRAMFLDSLSHPLSLLACVLPDPEAEIVDPRAVLEPDGESGRIRFGYRSGDHTIACRVELIGAASPPREVSYGFDGFVARRILHLPDYSMEMADAQRPERRIPLPDPSPLLVRSFLHVVETRKPPGVDPAALPGMRHLVRLMQVVPEPTPETQDLSLS